MIKNIETNVEWHGEEAMVGIDKVITSSVFAAGLIVEAAAVMLCPINEGRLRGSITTKTKEQIHTNDDFSNAQSNDIINAPTEDNTALIGTACFYGPYVEYGTRPHFPPIEPIEQWAKQKIGESGLGYVIARAISQRGTQQQPFMRPAFDLYQGEVLQAFEKNGKIEFDKYFKEER